MNDMRNQICLSTIVELFGKVKKKLGSNTLPVLHVVVPKELDEPLFLVCIPVSSQEQRRLDSYIPTIRAEKNLLRTITKPRVDTMFPRRS